MTKRVEGSMLRKIVASELQRERDNCNFDQTELADMFLDPKVRANRARFEQDMKDTPGFENTHKYYEMSAEEK